MLFVSLFHVSDGGLLATDLSCQRFYSTLPAWILELLVHTDLLLQALNLLLCKADSGIVFAIEKKM